MSLHFTAKKDRSVFQAMNNPINDTAQQSATRTPHLHFTWLVNTRHLLKNFMHEPKNVKKRKCINKYISVTLTNTLSTAKQRNAVLQTRFVKFYC
jgi:hypothetical protein